MARTCTVCGNAYYRRNQTEIWMGRNPGHRGGWQKLYIRICNLCLSPAQANQMLYQANVRAVKTGRKYRAIPIQVRMLKVKPVHTPARGATRVVQRPRVLA